MSVGDEKAERHHLRYQITIEETSLLTHKDKLGGFAKEYFSLKKRVKDREIISDDEEEHEYYNMSKFNFDDCKNKITDLTEWVKTLAEELTLCEVELAQRKNKALAKTALFSGVDVDMEDNDEFACFDSEASIDPTNALDNDMVGLEEQFD